MSADCTFRNTILKEQIDLVRLIKEIEESVTAVKGQINALSVETLHLKYLMILRNKQEAESTPSTSSVKPSLDLTIKQEKNVVVEFDEDDDEEG